jgi:hypothetical protein
MLPGGGQPGQQASVFGFQFRDAGLELGVVFAQSSDLPLLLLLAPLAREPSHAYAS